MAAPVIDPKQSVPDFDQFEPWGFQPYATNYPTTWQASGLPPGVVIDGVAGLISGAATLPGTYQFALTATNSDGVSAQVSFVVGIRPAPPPAPSGAVVTVVDLDTRAVTFTAADPKLGLLLKRGDDIIFQIQFVRNNVGQELAVTALKTAFKDDETEEPPLILSQRPPLAVTGTSSTHLINATAHGLPNGTAVAFTSLTGGTGLTAGTAYYVVTTATDTFQLSATPGGTPIAFSTDISAGTVTVIPWIKVGSGTSTVYRLYVQLAAADDAFPGYPADETSADVLTRSETVQLLGEFEWQETNGLGVGPATIRSSSQSWAALLVRDLIANTSP
jgi:hypothetical protein